MQCFPAELFLANLKGEIDPESRGYATKEQSLAALKEETGQDSGWDVGKLEAYVWEMYAHIPKPRSGG